MAWFRAYSDAKNEARGIMTAIMAIIHSDFHTGSHVSLGFSSDQSAPVLSRINQQAMPKSFGFSYTGGLRPLVENGTSKILLRDAIVLPVSDSVMRSAFLAATVLDSMRNLVNKNNEIIFPCSSSLDGRWYPGLRAFDFQPTVHGRTNHHFLYNKDDKPGDGS